MQIECMSALRAHTCLALALIWSKARHRASVKPMSQASMACISLTDLAKPSCTLAHAEHRLTLHACMAGSNGADVLFLSSPAPQVTCALALHLSKMVRLVSSVCSRALQCIQGYS